MDIFIAFVFGAVVAGGSVYAFHDALRRDYLRAIEKLESVRTALRIDIDQEIEGFRSDLLRALHGK